MRYFFQIGCGAIDHPDRSEQVLDQHYILDVTEKNFKDDISMIHRQKNVHVWCFKGFHTQFYLL